MSPSTNPRPALRPTVYNPLVHINIRVCPECSGPVTHNSGCITCRQCGWGRCD